MPLRSVISILLVIGSCVFVCSCGNKKKTESSLFPIHSFLLSQVASADSSLLPIRKITLVTDSTQDTVYIHRTDFRKEAHEFLDLPDIATSEFDGRFTETQNYDQDLDRVIIYQVPVDPDKETIQRQELLIEPNPSGDQIRTVIINSTEVSRDSSILKRMIWNVDASFQVTRILQLPGKPELIHTYRLEWNINE